MIENIPKFIIGYEVRRIEKPHQGILKPHLVGYANYSQKGKHRLFEAVDIPEDDIKIPGVRSVVDFSDEDNEEVRLEKIARTKKRIRSDWVVLKTRVEMARLGLMAEDEQYWSDHFIGETPVEEILKRY